VTHPSAKEIIGNESQERMGLVIAKENIDILQTHCRQRTISMYQVGDVTVIVLHLNQKTTGAKPMDYALEDFFGSSQK
jgi:phosphoribosylformylglycinamidine synthase